MAKITTTSSGTKFDPNNNALSELQRLGLKPTTETTQFELSAQKSGIEPFSDINIGEFKPDSSLFSNDAQARSLLEEQRAREQGMGAHALYGLGRVGSTILTEVLKVPGYLGGALGSSVMEGDFIENAVNNAWVNAFETADETIKSQMPVYLTQDVQNGNIGKKLLSSSWWATTGADGVGFLLSMYMPGQFLKALNIGSYLAKGVEGLAKLAGAESGFTKVLTAGNILKNTMAGVKATDKAVEGLQSLSAVAINTYVESASEAANTFDNVKKSFIEANPNTTDEEANQAAGKAAASVMKANIGVLALSNMFDEIFLFKGFNQTAEKTAKESVLGKLFENGKLDVEAISKLKREGIKEWSKKSLPKLASNFAKEGFFEEGLQTKIQQHYEDVSSGKTQAGFWEDVVGGYMESLLTNPEMQESVVLGGILGGGASMVEVANSIKHRNEFLFGQKNSYPSFLAKVLNRKEEKPAPGMIKILQDNFVNSFRTIHDIAELDENGKPVIENGRIKIDEAKFKEMIEQKQNVVMLNQLHNIAILEGNRAEEDMFGDQLTFNYFLPFLQQEGGYEVLKQHIDSQLVDLMAKKVEDATGHAPSEQDKQGIKAKLNKKADEFKAVYDDAAQTTNTEMYVRPANKNYGAWKQTVRDRKMQALITYNSATKAIADINTKFPQELTDDEIKALSPVQAIEYLVAKKSLPQYEELANKAKQSYVDLSSKKGLNEDYERYNKKIEEIGKNTAEEIAKENEGIDNVATSEEFENEITAGGYETIRNKDMKGFYIKGERLVVENNKGQRGMLESVYDPKTKESHQYFINSSGKRTKVTDENGNLTQSFLSTGFRPLSKARLTAERKAQAIKERKQAQLILLQESIDYRAREIGSHQKEVDEIDKQIEEYTEQLKKAQEELATVMATKVSNKARSVKKKQLKIQKETLEATVRQIEDTITNLRRRQDYLKGLIPRLTALMEEYKAIQAMIADAESFSIKGEKQRVEDELFTRKIEDWIIEQKDIDDVNELIGDIEKRIDELEQVKRAIRNTLSANEAFISMIELNEKEYEKAFREFDNFFSGIPIPYAIQRIHQLVTSDLDQTVGGETLAKNNIITNAVEIANWFNEHPEEIARRFGNNKDSVTEEDIYNKIVSILKPYLYDTLKLRSNSPLTLEDIHDLKARVFVTNRELDELHKMLVEQKERLDTSKLYKRYLVLERLLQERYEKRYNQLRNEQAERNLDFSQRQKGSFAEPTTETDMRDVFYQHALPSTPFSTTGISVLYEKEGPRRGKDRIDENGYPELNDNEFQRTWFLTVDKLSDEIANYRLLPVKAKYDSSDDFQKAIEANFPNEAQRSENDVFVFLVDQDGKPIKVDKQGNLLKDGGSFVFTSLRKSEEIFPLGKNPKIAPDYVLNEYLHSLGLKTNLNYAKEKNRKVGDVFAGKVAKKALASYIDADKTIEDLFQDAINWSRNEYNEFIKAVTSQPGYLKIESTTRGYPLYQVDKEGNKIQRKPLSVFDNVKLDNSKENKKLDSKQLQGATLGVVVNEAIESKGQTITLPDGTIYMKFDNGEFVTLQSRTITKDEAKTILFLLSLADTTNPLNTITLPFPTKKDGTPYYYYFNGQRVEGTMPVFARRMKNGSPFSLMHTLINYGFKSEGKNKKGEIYIQSGKIHYTNFNGESFQINIKEVSDAIKSDKFEGHSDAVADLFNFLMQKRFNVEKNLVRNNGVFMYPKLRKLKNGQYDVEFDKSNTYYEYLLNNVLTTSATKKEGYPSHLQRNVVFDREIVPIKKETQNTTAATKQKKGTTPPKVNKVTTDAKAKWLAEKRVNLVTWHEKYKDSWKTQPVETEKLFDEVITKQLKDQSEKLGFDISAKELASLKDIFKNGPQEAVQSFDDFVAKNSVTGDVFAKTEEQPTQEPEIKSEKKMTPKEKLEALRGEKTPLKPKTGMAKPKGKMDKIVDPNKLLDEYIEQGIVQKNCK